MPQFAECLDIPSRPATDIQDTRASAEGALKKDRNPPADGALTRDGGGRIVLVVVMGLDIHAGAFSMLFAGTG